MHSARVAHARLSESVVRIGDPVKLKRRLTEDLSPGFICITSDPGFD